MNKKRNVPIILIVALVAGILSGMFLANIVSSSAAEPSILVQTTTNTKNYSYLYCFVIYIIIVCFICFVDFLFKKKNHQK